MKTLLKMDKDSGDFEKKLSNLQVCLLEQQQAPSQEPVQEDPKTKKQQIVQLTGKETEMGSTVFNLA